MLTWLRAKKDDIVMLAIVVGLIVLFVVVAPYCC